MPGKARPACVIPTPKMQSTGQAGPEVNRDLEVLFDSVGHVIRCLSKLREFANNVSQGAFGGGEGGAGGDEEPGNTQQGTTPLRGLSGNFMYLDPSSNTTLPEQFAGIAYIEPSAAIEVTLPSPEPGALIVVANANVTHAITLKDNGGTTIGTIAAGGYAIVPTISGASGVWDYPALAIVVDGSGVLDSSVVPTSGLGVIVQDEGVTQTGLGDSGSVDTINFEGAGVTASVTGMTATVTIPGGGSPAATTVEVDLGSTPVTQGKFTITDAAISGTSKVLCWQAPGPYTGKGTRADEAEMQPVSVIAVEPGSGSAVVKWQTPPMTIEANAIERRAPNFGNGTAANSGTNRDPQTISKRIGKVRGNVKFTYLVLS